MLSGSRYNDQKERLETQRQSFFVSQAPSSFRRYRSAGSPGRSCDDDDTMVSRNPLVETTRTRSLDGVSVMVNAADAADNTTSIMNSTTSFFHQRSNANDNNPQDDFGSNLTSTKNRRMTTLPGKETPLLSGSGGVGRRPRSKSLMPLNGSCSSMQPMVDEKPVSTVPAT